MFQVLAILLGWSLWYNFAYVEPKPEVVSSNILAANVTACYCGSILGQTKNHLIRVESTCRTCDGCAIHHKMKRLQTLDNYAPLSKEEIPSQLREEESFQGKDCQYLLKFYPHE